MWLAGIGREQVGDDHVAGAHQLGRRQSERLKQPIREQGLHGLAGDALENEGEDEEEVLNLCPFQPLRSPRLRGESFKS